MYPYLLPCLAAALLSLVGAAGICWLPPVPGKIQVEPQAPVVPVEPQAPLQAPVQAPTPLDEELAPLQSGAATQPRLPRPLIRTLQTPLLEASAHSTADNMATAHRSQCDRT